MEILILWSWSRTWRDSVFNNWLQMNLSGKSEKCYSGLNTNLSLEIQSQTETLLPALNQIRVVLKATTDWASNSESKLALTPHALEELGSVWKVLCKPINPVGKVAKNSAPGQQHQLWKRGAIACLLSGCHTLRLMRPPGIVFKENHSRESSEVLFATITAPLPFPYKSFLSSEPWLNDISSFFLS